MKRVFKSFLSIMLCICMVATFLPVITMAETQGSGTASVSFKNVTSEGKEVTSDEDVFDHIEMTVTRTTTSTYRAGVYIWTQADFEYAYEGATVDEEGNVPLTWENLLESVSTEEGLNLHVNIFGNWGGEAFANHATYVHDVSLTGTDTPEDLTAGYAMGTYYAIVLTNAGDGDWTATTFNVDENGMVEIPKTTVTFNLNGGTYSGDEKDLVVSVTPSTSNTTNEVTIEDILPGGTFSRNGYTLAGWATATEPTTALEKVDAPLDGNNVDLYAIWELADVKIEGKVDVALTDIVLAAGATDSTYELVGTLPTGIAFNETTRTISGTPTQSTKASGADGVVTLTYNIKNAGGTVTDSATVTVDIAKGDQVAPTVTPGATSTADFKVTIANGAYYKVTESAAEPDTSELTQLSDGNEVTIFGSAGKTYYVHAYFPGNDNYNPSAITTSTGITLGKLTTSIAFDGTPDTSVEYNSAGVAFPTVVVKDENNTTLPTDKYTFVWKNADGDTVTNATDVDTYTVTVTITDTTTYNQPGDNTLTFEITPKPLTITWNNPVFAEMDYNGKSKTDVANPTSGAPTLSDGATPVITYARTHSNANDAVPVKATITDFTVPGGQSKGNYKLPETVTNENVGTVKVKKLNLSINDNDYAVTKEYDGTVTAGVDNDALKLSGVIPNDEVTLRAGYVPGDYAADAVGVGENKTITVSGLALEGAQSGNYVLAGTHTFERASITKKKIKIDTITLEKPYDGDTDLDTDNVAAATFTGVNGGGVVYGETVTLAVATENGAKYSQANQGENIPIVGNFTLTGTDAGNYELEQPTDLKGKIDVVTLSFGVEDLEKTYDGDDDLDDDGDNKAAILDTLWAATADTTDDKDEDVLTLNFAAITYPDENADLDYADMLVNGTLQLSGSASGNYILGTVTLKGKINKANQVLTREDTNGDVLYENGETLALTVQGYENPTLHFASSNNSFATVSDSGVVTPVGEGTVTITVTADATTNYNAIETGDSNVLEIVLTVSQKKVLTVTGITSNVGKDYGEKTFNVSEFGDSLTFVDTESKPVDLDYGVDYEYEWETGDDVAGAANKSVGGSYIKPRTYTAKLKLINDAADLYQLDADTTKPTLTVRKGLITINGITLTKGYDGDALLEQTNKDVLDGIVLTDKGLKADDRVTLDYSNAVYNSANVAGANSIDGVQLAGDDAGNYNVSIVIGASIAKHKISLDTGDHTVTKTYDGLTGLGDSDDMSFTVDGIIIGADTEEVTIAFTAGSYDHANASTNTVDPASTFAIDITTATFTVNGETSGNYEINPDAKTVTGVISKANQDAPTISEADGDDTIEYGDPLALTAVGASVGGYVWSIADGSDCASLESSGATATLKATKPGTVKVTVYKAGNGNYNDSDPGDYTVTIVKKTLSITPSRHTYYKGLGSADLSATFKIAENLDDLQTAPALKFEISSGADATTTMNGDNKTLSFTAADADVMIEVTLAATSDYYELPSNTTVEVDIDNAPTPTVTFSDNLNHRYDGTGKEVTITSVDQGANVEDFEVYYTGTGGTSYSESTTAPKNVGTYKVTAKSVNSNFSDPNGEVTLTIQPKPITIVVDAGRDYNGSDEISSLTELDKTIFTDTDDDEIVAGDTLTLTAVTATYFSKNVHEDKAATVTSSTFTDGNDANGTGAENYTITLEINGSIAKKAITIATTADRAYNGNNTAIAVGDLDQTAFTSTDGAGIAVDETITVTELSGYNYSSADVHAPTAPAAIGTATFTDGDDTNGTAAENYTITFAITTGEITPADVTLAATRDNSATQSAVSGGVKLSDLLEAAGLVIGETLGDYDSGFDAVLTFNENIPEDVMDNTWTATVNGAVFTVQFVDEEENVLAATPSAVGAYSFLISMDQAVGDSGNYTSDEVLGEEAGVFTITSNPVLPSGGGSVTTFTVTYNAGENGTFAADAVTTEKVKRNEAPKNAPVATANDGYKFLGWSKDGETVVDLSQEKITKNTTYTALYAAYGFADETSHFHYMIGRDEEIFAPEGNLTRAEAATILARLTPGFEEDGAFTPSSFTDVEGHWADKYVSFAQANGIISGYEDGSFRPDEAVTRGEFSAMIVRFKNIPTVSTGAGFSDVEGNWAEDYIAALVDAGIVGGYEDGTFRPEQTITRAEAARIVNGAIGRTPNEELDLLDAGYVNRFADVNVSDWFFHNVMEATADHVAKDFH